MTLPKPDLDDRTFDQLVEEATKLIPRYAPRWTDHNLSDPGITFIDLFSWLTEITLYRINLLTDRHRLKYLKLLGVSPKPPGSAEVDLTFESAIITKNGTMVYVDKSGENVYFEIDDDLATDHIELTPVNLKKVIVDEMTGGVFDRTYANEEPELYYAPFGLDVRGGCTMYLGFDGKVDPLCFMCYLHDADLIRPGKHGDEEDYQFKNVKLKWQISTQSGWEDITPEHDKTDGFKKSGKLLFEGLDNWESSKISVWEDKNRYFWLRCVIEESQYEYPPRIETIIPNTLRATHGLTIKDDSEQRISNGLPGQVFYLKKTPVLDGTLDISVNKDGVEEKWKEVDDFDGSGPEDIHFILDKERGEIRFGDGLRGKIPEDGTSINVIQYRVGGGTEGNISAGYEWKVEDQENLKVINYRGAASGTDAEKIEEAILRFLEDLRTPYPAVTSLDFEHIAVNTPGLRVAKVKAIPNYHPQKSNGKGSVTVAVIPYTYLERPPEPSRDFSMAVCRHLDKHRLIGTNVHVISPVYVKVTASAVIVPKSGFPEGTLKLAIINRLNSFFHPIKGWEDGSGWPIGKNVSRSRIFELIENIEGVKCVIKLTLSGDMGAKPDKYGNLILPSKIATIYSGRHKLTFEKESDKCRREGRCHGKD